MPVDNRACFMVNLRDRLCCRNCGKAPAAQENYHRGFEYHHILPQSQGGGDTAGNLILLCHACHESHHKGQGAPLPAAGMVPENFSCHQCAATLSSSAVEMNCGWYACHACGETTHLYTHCLAAPGSIR